MKLAVIKTGGKQYKIKEGDEIKVEKVNKKIGEIINLEKILLVSDEKAEYFKIGNPFVKDIKVEAKILEQARKKKVEVVKYKAKTRYKRTLGHKQHYSKLKIIKIV
ncbi:MAG: 50S ribosomal protein L21 [Xanthomonadaceae bacterium]|nr:50S ribosomal protein L21 [Rhodospirillaceae bacterium]NIA17968.1 50S ribosomal protein L21 [Xanthomonadaceae bacterium]